MNAGRHDPPRHGEGDRAQRGGGDSRFVARPEVALARKLRKDMSLPERMLWQLLRQRPGGFKFRRQHPIGPYVVDFCCLSERFVVEVDGNAHGALAGALASEFVLFFALVKQVLLY